MKKPNVFVNKINKTLKNNETIFTSFNDLGEHSITSLDSTSVRKKIKEIMDSPTYVYKADVVIKTDKGTFNKQIVGINNDRLLTIDNSFIDIRDIRNIELKK